MCAGCDHDGARFEAQHELSVKVQPAPALSAKWIGRYLSEAFFAVGLGAAPLQHRGVERWVRTAGDRERCRHGTVSDGGFIPGAYYGRVFMQAAICKQRGQFTGQEGFAAASSLPNNCALVFLHSARDGLAVLREVSSGYFR